MAGESSDSSNSIPASLLIDTSSYTVQQLPKLDTVKLSEGSYVLWKHQVMLVVEGYGLMAFLSEHKVPDKTVVNDSGQTVPNPIFLAYLKQDKLLASWLLSTVSADLLPHLTGLASSRAVWDALARRFAAKSSTKISSLRHNLHSQRKRGKTVSEYLAQIKLICDTLNASGHAVSDQEQVSVVLSGLSAEFESVIAVASRETLTLESLSEMLFECEARQQEFLVDELSIQANMVTRSTNKASTYNTNDRELSAPEVVSDSSSQLENSGFNSALRGQRSASFRGRGRGRFGNNRPQCQLCGRYGHLVHKCWYRFDQSYPGVLSGENVSSNLSLNSGTSTQTGFNSHSDRSGPVLSASSNTPQVYTHVFPANSMFVQPYMANGSGVSTGHQGQGQVTTVSMPVTPSSSHPTRAHASVMANSFSPVMGGAMANSFSPMSGVVPREAVWYPDSGATHHITSDRSNLQTETAYTVCS